MAHHGLQYLPILSDMYEKITALATTADTAMAIARIEEICEIIRTEWRHQGLATGTDSFLLAYAPCSYLIFRTIHYADYLPGNCIKEASL